jgi:hypothetical protein
MSIPNVQHKIGTKRRPASPPDAKLREAVSKAIKRSKKGRDVIARQLTEEVGFKVTARMLNDFSSLAKKPSRFPAVLIRAFCKVTGDDELHRIIMSPRLRRLLRLADAELHASLALRELDGLRHRELERAKKKVRR